MLDDPTCWLVAMGLLGGAAMWWFSARASGVQQVVATGRLGDLAPRLGFRLQGPVAHGTVGGRPVQMFASGAHIVLRLDVPEARWSLRSGDAQSGDAVGDRRFDRAFRVDWSDTDPSTLEVRVRDALHRLAARGKVKARVGAVQVKLMRRPTLARLEDCLRHLDALATLVEARSTLLALAQAVDEPMALRARALRHVPDGAPTDGLEALLDSPDPRLRVEAALRLGRFDVAASVLRQDLLPAADHDRALRALPAAVLGRELSFDLASGDGARWGRFAAEVARRPTETASYAWVAWWKGAYDLDRKRLAFAVAETLRGAPIPGGVDVLVDLVGMGLDDRVAVGRAIAGIGDQASGDDLVRLRALQERLPRWAAAELRPVVAELAEARGGAPGQLSMVEVRPEEGALSVSEQERAGRLAMAAQREPGQ